MQLIDMRSLSLANQRVLIREDFNVPMQNGIISGEQRITAALPTILLAKNAGARVILMSHLGRPEEGVYNEEFSLAPVAACLSQHLKQPVRLIKNWHSEELTVAPGEVVLLENVRLLPGENADDPILSKQMAALCDVFVMDAFATAHRAQASTHGVARFAPIACAGLLLMAEVDALSRALQQPTKPLVAIVGGAKISTKLPILQALLDKVDTLIVGGGIANTLLAAKGYTIGKSLYEKDLLDSARQLLAKAAEKNIEVPLPIDVIVAEHFDAQATGTLKKIDAVANDEMILDIGPQTALRYCQQLQNAGTIVWNGPLGVFEFEAFSSGTAAIAKAIADSPAFSIAGGGDTLAAIDKFAVTKQISYISTAGGAFLEFLEGKTLPGLNILKQRAQE